MMIGKLKREVGNLVAQSCCFCPVWWETTKFDLSSENNERFLPLICCIIISCTAEIYHPFCLILSEASSNLTSLELLKLAKEAKTGVKGLKKAVAHPKIMPCRRLVKRSQELKRQNIRNKQSSSY